MAVREQVLRIANLTNWYLPPGQVYLGLPIPKYRPKNVAANNGVIRNANGGVNFAKSADVFPVGPGQKNIVRIEYTGSRARDFEAANRAAGFGKTQKAPRDYTWHHLDDYDPATNTGTMQLVKRSAHEAT